REPLHNPAASQLVSFLQYFVRVLLGGFLERQSQLKAEPVVARRRYDHGVTAVHAEDAAAEGKAQTRSPREVALFHRVKLIEDGFPLVRRQAGTVIADADDEVSAAL